MIRKSYYNLKTIEQLTRDALSSIATRNIFTISASFQVKSFFDGAEATIKAAELWSRIVFLKGKYFGAIKVGAAGIILYGISSYLFQEEPQNATEDFLSEVHRECYKNSRYIANCAARHFETRSASDQRKVEKETIALIQ